MTRRTLAVLSLLACPLTAGAQTFPTKPVRIVVPFAAGGGVDLAARVLAQLLTDGVGQTFVVENRPGASGMIGVEFVAKSPPDGYTLLVGSQTTQAVVPAMFPKVPYDAMRDFTGVTQIATSPLLLVVNPSLPVKTVKELIALAKVRPKELTFGAASGGTPHMAGELFQLFAGVKFQFVPYKGEGPAVADAMGGHITMVFSNLPVALPVVRSGRLRALGVTSAQRASNASDIPTVAESGLPGFDASSWFGLFAPSATPREVVNKLAADSARVLTAADAREKLAQQGLFVVASTPEQFAVFLRAEISRWAKVVRDSGVKPE